MDNHKNGWQMLTKGSRQEFLVFAEAFRVRALSDFSLRPSHYLILMLAFASLWLLRNASQTWNGLDGGGLTLIAIARNYVRYGIWDLRLAQAANLEPVSNLKDLTFYQHHPPLVTLLLASGFYLFGESEVVARLVPILFCLGNILLLFALARKVYGQEFALFVTFVFSTFPGVLFFGRMPGYETPTLFFILLTLWLYLCRYHEGGWTRLLTLYAALSGGLLLDWPAYFLAFLIPLHCWLFTGNLPKAKNILFGIPLFSTAIFILLQLQSEWANPGSFEDLLNQGFSYMGLISEKSHLAARFPEAQITFTLFEYIVRVLSRLDLLFSYPVLILAVFGLWQIRQARTSSETLVFVLLGVGLAYCIVFYRSVYIHYWHTYYLSAPLAILTALGVRSLFKQINIRGKYTEADNAVFSNCYAIVFIAALVISGTLPRLWSLHQIQTKILPGNQNEKATFLKDVGLKLTALSQPQDVIFTNLPPKAEKPIGFYAARRIVWSVDSPDTLVEQIKLVARAVPFHFFFWLPETSIDQTNKLYDNLRASSISKEIAIDGYRFVWFDFPNPR